MTNFALVRLTFFGAIYVLLLNISFWLVTFFADPVICFVFEPKHTTKGKGIQGKKYVKY